MLPIVLEGQIYYDETKNDYLVVTRNRGGLVSYAGQGFRGQMADEDLVERFQPVDPIDVLPEEQRQLLDLCQPGTTLKVGFIREEE